MPYYPWPAAAIDADDMSLLHGIRESSSPRIPITMLIKKAIREFCKRNKHDGLPSKHLNGEK